MLTPSLRSPLVAPIVLAVTSFLIGLRPITETDPLWHLSLGRAVVRAGARVVPEPHAVPDLIATIDVPEWLWAVGAYGVTRAGGYPALCVAGAALSALVAWVTWAGLRDLARARAIEADLAAPFAATATALAGVLLRVHDRPETLVHVMLPASWWLASKAARGVDAWTRAAFVLLTALWAQTHPTAVIAPAVLVIHLGSPWLDPARRDARRAALARDLTTVAAALAALFTGTMGVGLVRHVARHAAGETVRSVLEMRAFRWSDLASSDERFLLGVAGGALVAAALRRRARPEDLGCSLLGLALTVTARRGVFLWAALSAPLWLDLYGAALAATPTRLRRLARAAAFAWAAALLLRGAAVLDAQAGPLFRVGLDVSRHPTGIARALAQAPSGYRVLTDYNSGAFIGWALDGRARTFVDSRALLMTDEATLALERALDTHPRAFALLVERYRFDAAVVTRRREACDRVAATPGWYPAAIDPAFTLFVRAEGPFRPPPLRRLVPCGPSFVGPESCDGPGAPGFAAEIAAMGRLAERPFGRFLEAERLARCRVPGVTLGEILARVPSPSDSIAYPGAVAALRSTVYSNTNDRASLRALVADEIARGNTDALLFGAGAFLPEDAATLRVMVEAALAAEAGDARAPLRLVGADACLALGDEECALRHGLLAAAAGEGGAARALCWLATNARSERARADARAWVAASASRCDVTARGP